MPIYEYRCEACGEQEEKVQSFSAPEAHDCPECGAGQGMKRQLSVAGFALSGGGWYAQGYGQGAASAEAKPSKPTGGGCPHGGCGCA